MENVRLNFWDQGIFNATKKGIEQGRQEGIEQGIQKGEINKSFEIAINMLSDFNDTQIHNATKLPLETIEKLRNENNK